MYFYRVISPLKMYFYRVISPLKMYFYKAISPVLPLAARFFDVIEGDSYSLHRESAKNRSKLTSGMIIPCAYLAVRSC